ncbi:MAG TPA: SnoaL-like domain-containing protein [Puia sp.]|nr:SnoaL-like domain-containing protein [Puia sp.]
MIKEQTRVLTTQEVADRFNELAQQEKWFEIQDEFFSENIVSLDPLNSPYFGYAEGKSAVRQKGENFVKRVQAVHHAHTTSPLVTGNHFAVGRELDMTVEGHGRIQIKQIMLYEVIKGKIVQEKFFY